MSKLKLCKVINEETKEVVIGAEEQQEIFIEDGFSFQEVDVSYDNRFYLKGYAPEKPASTWEEIDKARIKYRKAHIDDKTIARMRKTANRTWTEQDEQDYLALDAEVTAWIEENLPYPVGV